MKSKERVIPNNIKNKYPIRPLANAKDYREHKLGKLTILYRTDNIGKAVGWVALCECGEYLGIRSDHIKHEKTLSCAECRIQEERDNYATPYQDGVPIKVLKDFPERRLGKASDRHGDRVGRLTAIYRTEPTNVTTWLYKCDCGNYEAFNISQTEHGAFKQCSACYGIPKAPRYNNGVGRIPEKIFNELVSEIPESVREEHPEIPLHAASNIMGQEFGKLVPLYRTKNVGTNIQYLSICSCGSYISTNSSNLSRNQTVSCGCEGESVGEYLVGKRLKEIGSIYKREYKFEDLKNPDTNAHLRFDFAVFDGEKLSYLIEFDGKQHLEETSFFTGSLDDLQYRDEQKNEYSRANNIPLIRIPYTVAYSFTTDDIKLGSKYTISETKRRILS